MDARDLPRTSRGVSIPPPARVRQPDRRRRLEDAEDSVDALTADRTDTVGWAEAEATLAAREG